MSYILDALRRADAQRERGAVPDVHAQPQIALPRNPPARVSGPLPWVIAAAVLVLLAGVAWWLVWRGAPPELERQVAVGVATAPPPPMVVTPPSPMPAGTALPPPPAPTSAQLPAPVPTTPPPLDPTTPSTLAPASAVRPGPPNLQLPRPAKAQAATVAPKTAPAPRASAPANHAKPAAAREQEAPAEPRIYTRDQLPGDVRGQLPPLNISGSTYSENPAHRMLIANGQVFHENERITAELTLEQIRLKGAVLSFRGYRYLVPF